jgi:hypothetical protein
MRAQSGLRMGAVKVALLGLVMVAAGGWVLWPEPPDRQSLDELVARAKHGFETRSASEIIDCVAPGYRDDSGLTREDVSRICERIATQAKQVQITITPAGAAEQPRSLQYDIAIQSSEATGHFDVVATLDLGGETVTWPMRLEVRFVKQDRSWRSLWRPRWAVASVNGHGVDKGLKELM